MLWFSNRFLASIYTSKVKSNSLILPGNTADMQLYHVSGIFPGGPVVKNLPCNAKDKGLIPDRGIKIKHVWFPSRFK